MAWLKFEVLIMYYNLRGDENVLRKERWIKINLEGVDCYSSERLVLPWANHLM